MQLVISWVLCALAYRCNDQSSLPTCCQTKYCLTCSVLTSTCLVKVPGLFQLLSHLINKSGLFLSCFHSDFGVFRLRWFGSVDVVSNNLSCATLLDARATMRCVLPAINVKLFAKAVHCLAKIGSEVYFEPLEAGLALKTVNSSRSAYICFLFLREMFQTYSYGESDASDESIDDCGSVRCKVAVKTMLQVFKSLSSIERSVESCDVNLDTQNCRLIFQLKCRHGITKTHHLTYQECESLQAVYAKDLSPNVLKCEHRLLMDVASNFPSSLEEISMNVSPCRVLLKSFVNEDDLSSKIMRTEMCLNPDEFSDFQIGVDTEVTFCLKDLRAILAFCDVASSAVQMHFEVGGKPLILSTEQDSSFRANFVLATVASEEGSEKAASASVNKTRSNLKQNRRISATTPGVKRAGSKTAAMRNGHQAATINHSAWTKSKAASSSPQISQKIVSPEIPDQNCCIPLDCGVPDEVEPSYKRIKTVFFEASQLADIERSMEVLAPDSDEEGRT